MNNEKYFVIIYIFFVEFIQDYLLREFNKKLYRNCKRYISFPLWRTVYNFFETSVLCEINVSYLLRILWYTYL